MQVPLAQLVELPINQQVIGELAKNGEFVQAPEDNPTIGLLLCRAKSDKKAAFSLRGITQPMGIAQYEIEQLFKDMASALPQIEDLETE